MGIPRCDIFEKVVENTLLEKRLVDRYVPLQFKREYAAYADSLKQYLQSERSRLHVQLMVRDAETVLPLVSLVVWAKAAQIAELASETDCIALKVFWSQSLVERPGPDLCVSRLRATMKAIGLTQPPSDIRGLVSQLDLQDVGAVAGYVLVEDIGFSKSSHQEKEHLVETMSCIASAAVTPATVTLCGQTQAVVFNILWQRLCKRLELPWPAMPAALFLPLMPFQGDTHIYLDDRREEIEQKLIVALKRLTSANQQLTVAADLLTLIPGSSRERDAARTALEGAASLTDATTPLAEYIERWLHDLSCAVDAHL